MYILMVILYENKIDMIIVFHIIWSEVKYHVLNATVCGAHDFLG